MSTEWACLKVQPHGDVTAKKIDNEATFKKAFIDRSNWGSVPSGRLKAREAYWK